MKNTIQNLWCGNISPGTSCGVNNLKIESLIILIERNKTELFSKLSTEQIKMFEKYIDCCDKYVNLISTEAFCDGFCLASKLLSEALAPED